MADPPPHSDSNGPSSDTTVSSLASIPSIVVLNVPISTKLTRSNFLTWKAQVLPALHGHGLYRFLEDKPPSRQITTNGQLQDNPLHDYWHRQDQLLLSWLLSSLTETILGQVVSCQSSADLWTMLQRTFSSSSRARLSELRRSLQTITKGGASCADFVQKVRAIADELAFIGSPVPEVDLILVILGGLGSEFNSLVVTANAKEDLSLADLQAMLFSHEALLHSQSGNSSSSLFSPDLHPSAYYSHSRLGSGHKSSNQRPYPNQSRGGHRPNYSQPRGNSQRSQRPNYQVKSQFPSGPRPTGPLLPTPHRPPYQANTTRPSTPNSAAFNPEKNTICQICFRRGHSALICWYLCDMDYSASQPGFQAHLAKPEANVAQPSTTQSESDWYLDSGATHHVTNDLNNLSTYMPYDGFDALHIGNGAGAPHIEDHPSS